MSQRNVGKQVSIIPAFSILATAFLASMSVSSFFFIQPGGANASVDRCVSQGIVTDSDIAESAIKIEIKLSEGCPTNNALIKGFGVDGILYELKETELVETSEGYSAFLELSIDSTSYEYYIVTIDGAFSAKIESNN